MPTVSPSLCHAKLSFGNWLKSTRITPTPTTVTPSTFLRRAQQPLVSHNERAAELLRWDLRLAMGTRSGHSWAQERPLWSYTTEVNMHSLCLLFSYKASYHLHSFSWHPADLGTLLCYIKNFLLSWCLINDSEYDRGVGGLSRLISQRQLCCSVHIFFKHMNGYDAAGAGETDHNGARRWQDVLSWIKGQFLHFCLI